MRWIRLLTSYFLPVFGDAYGLGESQTSLLLVMNCLVGIFLSGTLTDVMRKSVGRFSMYLSSLLFLAAIVLFGYFQNLTMLAFVLLTLGTAKSFGAPIREIMFCGQKEVADFGEDRAMGLYNFADNVGESAGTVVFGAILKAGSLRGCVYGCITFTVRYCCGWCSLPLHHQMVRQ